MRLYTDQAQSDVETRPLRLQACVSVFAAVLLATTTGSATLAQDVEARSDVDIDAVIAAVDEYVVPARELLDSGRYDALDPEAIAREVGADAEALRDWVGTNTSWVPYSGALRGGRGVLIDGSGNSLDRSLLLAELLGAAGIESRLARADLDEAATNALVEGQLASAGLAAGQSGEELSREELTHRDDIAATAQALADQLGPTMTAASDPTPTALDAAADHWWVQADSADGWLDLDPLLTDEDRPEAGETYAADAIPDELRHRAIVRVVIERLDEDGLHEAVPFEYEYAFGGPSAFESLELSFWPGGPLDLEPVESVAYAAEQMTHWLPVLEVGADRISGEWFSNAGVFEDAPRLVQSEKLNDALDALGGLGATDEAPEPISTLSAVWLEYEVLSPGREPVRERREIYDLLGPAARAGDAPDPLAVSSEQGRSRGLALLGSTAMLMAPGFVSGPAAQQAYLQFLVDMREPMIATVLELGGSDDERIGRALDQAPITALDLLLMASARRMWSPVGTSVFVDGPSIWTRHDVYDVTDPDDAAGSAFDIVSNTVGVLPATDVSPQRTRLEQGVADTFVELEVSGGTARSNAFARYAEGVDGTDWTVLLPGDDVAVAGTSADDVVRLQATLDDGHVVVVGPPQTRDGAAWSEWWRVDPASGTTLGFGEHGWGAVTMEELYSRLQAYDRLAQYSIQAKSLCNKLERAYMAAARMQVIMAIAAGGSPVPPPIVVTCY